MILEFCDIENNVETINGIINYNIGDYISNIKINGFYGGFIELYAHVKDFINENSILYDIFIKYNKILNEISLEKKVECN